MTERVLDEAMRYGSRRSYDERDLGKFGLGLKTASLSQCRRLTVATKTTPKGRIRIRRWDLDDVTRRDAWELERLAPVGVPALPPRSAETRRDRRAVGEARPHPRVRAAGGRARRRAASKRWRAAIAEHLAMVFHRFLSGETRDGDA